MSTTSTVTGERADLIQTLGQHRYFLRGTADGLTDAQAAHRSTVSELTVGGLIKHVSATERQWVTFILEGPAAMAGDADAWNDPESVPAAAAAEYAAQFTMQPGETLAGILAAYEEVARRTDELVATLPDLDASHPLPEAPWFPPGARWSARRVLLHLIAETSQHAGHADIVREAIDGRKSMG